MRDSRIALENGYEIEAAANKRIKINAEIGRGANCIVYDATYKDSIGAMHNIRVKECYPGYLLMVRASNGGLNPFNLMEEKFKEAKERFIQAYRRNIDIKNTIGLTNSTINSDDIVSYNNTYYIIMSVDEGSDYRQYEDQSLKELLVHIKSLAELIKKYHDNGYLHLDIKPENVFILPETEEHILLFDFDSVITKDELAENGCFQLSFSEGFSPPEQIQGKVNKIDNHTDIFSIGALLFYKLFGRKATLEECMISYIYEFDKMRYFKEEYQPKLYKGLEKFLKKTLSASVVPRWNNMQQVIDCLDELIPLSDIDGVYLIDAFQYNSACFIGREMEIEKIHRILENNQLVFLSGIGGIGKTEIVKQYAKRYRNQYDTILFSVFEKDIESLVNDEIMINHVEKDESESEAEYFERKIEILRHIVTDKDLIIIDNFDVDSDDKLETLFCCPCKFIVTSRMDFRDYNYEQIDVDRMERIEEVLQLFYTYNDELYSAEDAAAVEKLAEYVDCHTMTIELISKYLRVSGEAPSELLNRFMEKEGTTNTGDIDVKQRKDRRLRSETINHHLETLFDASGFDETEKEIMGSLSLYAGIRIKRVKFEEICAMDNISNKLDKLMKRGWIEYNEKTEKISLHQVIQDLIYKNFSPCAENCPNIVAGMSRYITADTDSYLEHRIRDRVFDVFMSRITGENMPYVRLCMLYGREEKLNEVEQICLNQGDREAYDVLQRVYRKKIVIISNCYDMFEAELDLDDYISNKLKLIEELMNKAILCCQKYTNDSDYIIKEYVEIGQEINNLLANNVELYINERNPDIDRIYYKIIDMYDIATELLPKSSYTVDEKVKYYERIREFYLDGDYFFMYRCDFFSDLEKAYWYQERIDELRNEIDKKSADIVVTDMSGVKKYIYINDVSCVSLAEKYAEEGEYEKAIEYYQKAYEDGDEMYENTMRNIAHIYLKMGKSEKALECLEEVLDYDKENEKNSGAYFSYSSYICIELIKNLVNLQDYEKAKAYALELIHYEEPKLSKEDNLHTVRYILAAYYYLYYVESDCKKKDLLWQQCIRYYKMLEKREIDEDVFDFIIEYLMKEDVCYDEALEILERIDDWNTKEIKEKIICKVINKNVNAIGFRKYHVILLIKYASLFNEYPYKSIKKAESKCNEAQAFYLKYELNDQYIQSLIYNTKAEILSNDSDYEYDQVLEVKKKCNYRILAEHHLKKVIDDEKRIEIWRDAANSYGYVDNYEMQVYCLEKCIEIIVPILNLYDYSMFDRDYWYIMQDMIRARISLKDLKKAEHDINEVLESAMEFYLRIRDSDSISEYIRNLQSIAEFYIEISLNEKAVNIYLIALYMRLEKNIHNIEMLKKNVSDVDAYRLCKTINILLDGIIDNDIVDFLIDLKDKLLCHRDNYYGDVSAYDEMISKMISQINTLYGNQEIEFK